MPDINPNGHEEFKRDMLALDTSKCIRGSYYDNTTGCGCPLVTLAVSKGFEVCAERFNDESYVNVGARVMKFLKSKYNLPGAFFACFIREYDGGLYQRTVPEATNYTLEWWSRMKSEFPLSLSSFWLDKKERDHNSP